MDDAKRNVPGEAEDLVLSSSCSRAIRSALTPVVGRDLSESSFLSSGTLWEL